MNSPDIFDLIERVAATASKKEKLQLIAGAIHDKDFENVLILALDPGRVYGVTAKTIKSLDLSPHPSEGASFDDKTHELLGALSQGRVAGHAAQFEIARELKRLDPKSAELLARILNRDLRAGFTEGTVNKAKPGTIPEFPYMRCSLPDTSNMPKWDWSVGILSQEKADGMFANANVTLARETKFHSRQGTPFPAKELREVADFMSRFMTPGKQYHGELVVHDIATGEALPREISNGHMNAVSSGSALDAGLRIVYHVWDAVPLEAIALPKLRCDSPYKDRLKAILGELILAGAGSMETAPVRLIPTRQVRSKAEAYAHFGELVRKGKEGTVCKHPEAVWADGTSKDQVKLKLEVDVDLIAIAIVEGRVGTKNEGRPGSITCVTDCGELKVDVTVKNEAMRDAIEADPKAWLSRVYVVRSNLLMEPSESSDKHSLFLPRFVEASFRTDKGFADSLQSVKDQFRNAVEAA